MTTCSAPYDPSRWCSLSLEYEKAGPLGESEIAGLLSICVHVFKGGHSQSSRMTGRP